MNCAAPLRYTRGAVAMANVAMTSAAATALIGRRIVSSVYHPHTGFPFWIYSVFSHVS